MCIGALDFVETGAFLGNNLAIPTQRCLRTFLFVQVSILCGVRFQVKHIWPYQFRPSYFVISSNSTMNRLSVFCEH